MDYAGDDFEQIPDDVLSSIDISEESPIEGLELKEKTNFQREIIFNKLLPYADELDDEADVLFAKIKANLGRCVAIRDIKPGCIFWTNMLHKYLVLYDLRFTKEDHIMLIKLLYELITIPNLESTLIGAFGYRLYMLLRKTDLISPQELELPWRPIYDLYLHLVTRKVSQVSFYHAPSCLKTLLECLVYAANTYFPVNATQEILDELRPQICPFHIYSMQATMKSFELFLPVLLTPEYHSQGYKLWFHEFMKLWEVCSSNSAGWGSSMMQLMSKLAYYNIGYIDWEPYMSLMFTKFVQSFDLPVCYKKMRCNTNCRIRPWSIGLWIASVLGNKSSAQMYLDKFLKTMETYYHPVNHGSWVKKLGELFINITYFVINRLNRERYQIKPTWKTSTPDSHKLTNDDIDAFVNSMMPIAMIGIFNQHCSTNFYDALHYLCIMRPNIVIPTVLEKVYSLLDSNSEPSKLIAMTCMITISRPLVQGSNISNKEYAYENGPSNVFSILLDSVFRGIDPNDPNKCFTAFRLIATYVTMIPVADSSNSDMPDTWWFEEFTLSFMDKIFAWIDSSSVEFVRHENQTNGTNKSRSEAMAESMLNRVFTVLLRQMSHSIFLVALNKLRAFITEHVLETQVAGQLVAVLCKVFTNVNGHETLKALFPFLSEKVLDAIGEGDDVIKAENLDNHLLYPLLLLNRLVLTQGDALLPYMDTIIKILDKITRLNSREGNLLGCFTLSNVLQSFLSVSSINVDRNLDDTTYPYMKEWGETLKLKQIKLNTYIPGEEEFEMLQKVFTRYFVPAITTIENFIKAQDSLTREELQVTLRTIFNILDGCDAALPFWDEPPLIISPYENCIEPLVPILGIKYEIKMPDGSNVRSYVIKVMAELQEVMLKTIEDDTKSLTILELIWQNLLLGKLRLSVDWRFKFTTVYCISKKVVENRMTGNNGFFPTLVLARVNSQHQMRRLCTSPAFTETHKTVLLNILTLSTSHYSRIRMKAQETLQIAFGFFPNAYLALTPQILEILQKDPTVHHEAFKGILYVITRKINSQESLLVKQDWEFIKKLWPALVLSKPSEKESVIQLQDLIVDLVIETFYTLNIKLEIPDNCVETATKFWELGMKPSLPKPSEEDIEKGKVKLYELGEKNMKTYNEILDTLLNILLENNLHWRLRLMAMNFIYVLLHTEQKFPPQVIRFFLEALIHESIEERKIALRVLMYVFKQLKRKHPKIKIEVPTVENLSSNGSSFVVQPGCRSDNAWLQYNYDTRPTNSLEWDKPRYIHKSNIGFYTWPKELEVYAPSSQQPSFDRNDLSDHEKEIEQFFKNQQNVDKLIEYLSLEGKKGRDKFSNGRLLVFKGIFRNHGDAFLENFLPHLRKLVMDKQESSQRCAAEIICGLIKGSKHWPYEMTEPMWNSLIPIIRSALNNLTTETISDWAVAISNASKDRDPNRLHWLFECVMEESPLGQSEASFVECGRLMILQGALSLQSWKVTELLRRLLDRFQNRWEQSPFQNVRDRLSLMLVSIFRTNIKYGPGLVNSESIPDPIDFIEKLYPRLQSLLEDEKESKLISDMADMKIDSKSEESSESTLSLKPSNLNGVDTEREKNIRLFKIICRWILETVMISSLDSLSSFYKIYPIMCQLENNEKDEELSKVCSRSIAVLAQTLTPPEHMPAALEAVRSVSESSSWSARACCLEFLQALVFHNMSILLSNETWTRCVQDIVLRLLEDERLEVREKAAQVLSGLLHCTILPDQDSLLEEFKKKARTKLKKKKFSDQNNDNKEPDNKTAKISNPALRRHVGILGMCAFIQAHPYNVPKHVPPIFECLSSHLNDPEPIPSTIRKTLNDFKRTHYNGYTEQDKASFTDEQYAIMQDLMVPPSYYA